MLDGATDDKVPALDYKTPLQVSSMKFINSVASSGELGCTDAREYTHFFLLQLFSGKPLDVPRGVIEAFRARTSFGCQTDSLPHDAGQDNQRPGRMVL